MANEAGKTGWGQALESFENQAKQSRPNSVGNRDLFKICKKGHGVTRAMGNLMVG